MLGLAEESCHRIIRTRRMATSLSTIIHNTYIHGDCRALQIGKTNTVNENSNLTDMDEDDLYSEIEDLKFRMNRRSEDIDDMKTHVNDLASKLKTKDDEIAELKDRVADLEAFKEKVEQSEITTNTNTNTRHFNRDTSDDITLNLIRGGCSDHGTITISKKDSVNGLIKLIKGKINRMIYVIAIYRYRGGSRTVIYSSYFNNKNDYSLEQLGVVDQDSVFY